MRILNAFIAGAIVTGNLLSLVVWWWLFVSPIVRVCKRRLGKRPAWKYRTGANSQLKSRDSSGIKL